MRLVKGRGRGWRRGWVWGCAHDQEPKHEQELAKVERLHPAVNDAFVLGQEQGRKTVCQIGEAISDQQEPQDTGNKPGAVHEQPEGNEPKTPKYFGDSKSVTV